MGTKQLPFVFGITLAGLFASIDASADVQACLSASERGQRARATGQLREAREQLAMCAVTSCPALVRRDCARWIAEIQESVPSIVLGAKDRSGRDVPDVSVIIDDQFSSKRLDGKAVLVDPGKHTFRFEAAGLPPVTETVLVKEGERARPVIATFDTGDDPSKSSRRDRDRGRDRDRDRTRDRDREPERDADRDRGERDADRDHGDREADRDRDDSRDRTHKDESRTNNHTPYPWIVTGLGALGMTVGIIVAASAPDTPTNCDRSSQTCRPRPGEDTVNPADQTRAGTADAQPTLGYALVGIGAAVMLGGLIWHFLEPQSAPAPKAAPWMPARTSGVTLSF
jgi:hypothetical protein